jgi:hypothetical protein
VPVKTTDVPPLAEIAEGVTAVITGQFVPVATVVVVVVLEVLVVLADVAVVVLVVVVVVLDEEAVVVVGKVRSGKVLRTTGPRS